MPDTPISALEATAHAPLQKGRVLSVNVGQPQELVWRGEKVRTAICKKPVTGRVRVNRLNLEGDAQADLKGHGGEMRALMVYQWESYQYWQTFLKRTDFEYGQFGENLTVQGLADTEVCIGDRFRIGTAVFEISQPRVTCHKLAMRTNEPRMPALVVAHHRPGFYFRVIQEGEIGAGDEITQIIADPARLSVADTDAMLYLGRHSTEALRRSLKIPALSPGWQGSFRALLEAEESGVPVGNVGLNAPVPALAWTGLRPLEVIAIRQESDDVRSFELAAPDRSALPRAIPGQHLVLRLQVSPETVVNRIYSLCGAPSAPTYRIAVKRESGPGSLYLHSQVSVGDRLQSSAPRGQFLLTDDQRPVVLLSAGIGVTPLLSMLYSITRSGKASRDLWWIHAAKDSNHHSFEEEARLLTSESALAHSCIVYSHPAPSDRQGSDFDVIGRVNLKLLLRLGVPKDATFYVCGPAGYLALVQKLLGNLGIPDSAVHVENFGLAPALGARPIAGATPRRPDGSPGTGPQVTFIRSGLSLPWDSKYRTLLEFAEACAVPVRWSCRAGVCHSCECGVISGDVAYDPPPLDPPPPGRILTCCTSPASEITLDL